MAGYKRIALEIKEEILKKMKEEGASAKELAAQYGISDATIYEWLKAGVSPGASQLEINRLKRENQQLLLTIGFYASRMHAAKKGLQPDNWFTT